MKTLKKILLAVIILVLLFFVIALFLPQQVKLEREITIEAPVRVVYNQVNDFHSWEKWAVWNQLDPMMKVEYEHLGIGKGAVYHWSSQQENVGTGSMTITQTYPLDSILIDLDFGEQGLAKSPFYFEEQRNNTHVKWMFETDLGMNPIHRWFGLLFEGMIGPDYEKGLENLKVVAETIWNEKQPIVEIKTLPDMNYISMRDSVSHAEISEEMARMYSTLYQVIQTNESQMADMPFAIYHKIDGEMIELECGIPVMSLPFVDAPVKAGTLKSATYVEADHIGSYETLGDTHEFIQKWIQDRHFSMAGAPMEQYLTDPGQVSDQSQWITAIYYPIVVK